MPRPQPRLDLAREPAAVGRNDGGRLSPAMAPGHGPGPRPRGVHVRGSLWHDCRESPIRQPLSISFTPRTAGSGYTTSGLSDKREPVNPVSTAVDGGLLGSELRTRGEPGHSAATCEQTAPSAVPPHGRPTTVGRSPAREVGWKCRPHRSLATGESVSATVGWRGALRLRRAICGVHGGRTSWAASPRVSPGFACRSPATSSGTGLLADVTPRRRAHLGGERHLHRGLGCAGRRGDCGQRPPGQRANGPWPLWRRSLWPRTGAGHGRGHPVAVAGRGSGQVPHRRTATRLATQRGRVS